ncbi:MAG: NYN domain-containing protein [Armatimonadetes bacterium]|nr:NYN domain-containing protein [Armatimonadota bacterium]
MDQDRGKIICFIDESNIYHGQEEVGWKIDWQKFENYLGRDGQIWQTFFFASAHDPAAEIQNDFYRHLREGLRWEVQIYELGKTTVRCSKCNHEETVPKEKGVDIGIATKMLTLGMQHAYDTAVLVAGDRDYLEPVKSLKSQGLRVEVASWKHTLSDELSAESSSPPIYLDELRDEIEFKEEAKH